jgi:glycosyltransferase involved in cell wall biosynthesis
MRILILVDKEKSAIHRLALPIQKYNPHLDISIEAFHPKRPSIDQIEAVTKAWDEADLVHVSYWKSGEKFKELYPEKFASKRKVLWHHNPYHLEERDWNEDYKRITVHNEEMQAMIPYARLIPQCIDLDWFAFNKDYTDQKVVNMVAARIEGKKGIKEVARACKELDYKFVLVGRISKMNYFKQIMEVNPDIDFREDISEEELRDTYYESAIHVCNSIDNFESGTMPILESMAAGVPVLTRSVGHVPDLYNGDNMIIRSGDSNDYEDLRDELRDLMENYTLRNKIRSKAWQTIKNRPEEKMARMFCTLYYEVLSEKKPLVSVIVPTKDSPKVLAECLLKIVSQDYINKEVVVADSGNVSVEPLIKEFRKNTPVPIKYIYFKANGEYTLPKARNLATVEAQGKYLLFCDNRIGMEPGAITAFENQISDSTWLYGVKDNVEKGFVENFSFIKREDLIKFGMFNERIDCYGGASQELRTRFMRNGILLQRIYDAKAITLASSHSQSKRKPEIIRAKNIVWKLYGKDEF